MLVLWFNSFYVSMLLIQVVIYVVLRPYLCELCFCLKLEGVRLYDEMHVPACRGVCLYHYTYLNLWPLEKHAPISQRRARLLTETHAYVTQRRTPLCSRTVYLYFYFYLIQVFYLIHVFWMIWFHIIVSVLSDLRFILI